MFSNAIVRIPCSQLENGLTTANLGKPDFLKALKQHSAYVDALKKCGIQVIVLEADNNFPDSTFVEDTAVLTEQCAIIANPGVPSRKGEVINMQEVLRPYYKAVDHVREPGTLDGGDIMIVGSHVFIGLSKRTNKVGANQIIRILERHGMTTSIVSVKNDLHLKSGVSYIENNNLVVREEFAEELEFRQFNKIKVDRDESYAANCVWINGKVLIAKGFPKTKRLIESHGYTTIAVDVSQFRKLDAGLSCLSLRF